MALDGKQCNTINGRIPKTNEIGGWCNTGQSFAIETEKIKRNIKQPQKGLFEKIHKKQIMQNPTKTVTPKLNVLDFLFVQVTLILSMLPWDVNYSPSINFPYETLVNFVIFFALYGAERPAFQSCLTCWSFSG